SMAGTLLPGYGDAGRYRALGGARYDAASRALRRSRSRLADAPREDGIPRARVDGGLPAAGVLVRADVSEARGEALRRLSDSRRRRCLRPRAISPLASDDGCLQGPAHPAAGLRVVAPLRL